MQAKEEVIFTIIVLILILIFLAIMFLVFLARNNTRKNRLLFENERIRREFEGALLNTRLEIQEHTLDYVSREIHDNIGQTLSLARLQVSNEDDPAGIATADELLGKAIADLRALSHNLNTNHVKEIGLVDAMQSLAMQFQKTGKYQIHFRNDAYDFDVDEEKGLIIFRVVQEVLNNITKHAKASEILISLTDHDGTQLILIRDDGVGFDAGQERKSGIGLKNIRDRIGLIGGELSIQSEIGRGTEVKISLPNGKQRFD